MYLLFWICTDPAAYKLVSFFVNAVLPAAIWSPKPIRVLNPNSMPLITKRETWTIGNLTVNPNTLLSHFYADFSVTAFHMPKLSIFHFWTQRWSPHVDLNSGSRDICMKLTPQSIWIHCRSAQRWQWQTITTELTFIKWSTVWIALYSVYADHLPWLTKSTCHNNIIRYHFN